MPDQVAPATASVGSASGREAEPDALQRLDHSVMEVGFGVVLPLVCWWVNGQVSGTLLLGPQDGPPGAGALAVNLGGPVAGTLWLALLITAMSVWIVRRPGSPVLAGALAAAATWALAFGLLILPMTVIGLLIGIGILGFVPFGSAYECGRAARRAWAAAAQRCGTSRTRVRFWVAAFCFAGLPTGAGYAVQAVVDHDLATVLQGDAGPADDAVTRLRVLRPLLYVAGLDPSRDLALAWRNAVDGDRRTLIAHAFERLTGDEVTTSPYASYPEWD